LSLSKGKEKLTLVIIRNTNVSIISVNIMIKNVFIKPNEQNDARINSAMARKGGCEETNNIIIPQRIQTSAGLLFLKS
jgi:hypothetical protein